MKITDHYEETTKTNDWKYQYYIEARDKQYKMNVNDDIDKQVLEAYELVEERDNALDEKRGIRRNNIKSEEICDDFVKNKFVRFKTNKN